MPNITQYQAGAGKLQPTDMGAEAWNRAAFRIGSLANEAGRDIGSGVAALGNGAMKAVKSAQSSNSALEQSTAHATAAYAFNNYSNQLQDFMKTADPNDPQALQDHVQQTFEPMAQKMLDATTDPAAKKSLQTQVDTYRSHVLTSSRADQVNMAGTAVAQNLNQGIGQYVGMASTDPTSFATAMKLGDQMIDDHVNAAHGVSADVAAKMNANLKKDFHTELGQATIMAAAQKDPDATIANIQNGTYDSLGIDRPQALKAAQTIQKAGQKDAAAQAKQAEAQQKQQLNGRMDGIIQDVAVGDGAGNARIQPDTYKRFVQWGVDARRAGVPASEITAASSYFNKVEKDQTNPHTDPHVYQGFIQNLPNFSDPSYAQGARTQILTARADGQLSNEDFGFLMRQTGPNTAPGVIQKQDAASLKQFFNVNRPFIAHSSAQNPYKDPWGNQRFGEFQSAKTQEFEQGLKDGKTSRAMLDANSPDYIGGDLSKYQLTSEQLQNETAPSLPNAPINPLPPLGSTAAAPQVKWTQGMSMDDLAHSVNGK